jgi:Spy/CpxP family protein refolding chaperone
MKLNRIMTTCAVAATLCLSAGSLLAQNGGGGGFGGGGFGGGGFGGGGGGGRGGGGNFDPTQMAQMQLQRYQTQLNITNDTDWAAIQPLVQKVIDARTALGNAGRGGFGGGGRRGGGGGGGFGGQTVSVEQQALQNAIDNDAPSAQIKDALDKYEASQKTKQATLTAAQEALRAVLTPKQEAIATLLGLLS